RPYNNVLECESCMIGADDDAHRSPPLVRRLPVRQHGQLNHISRFIAVRDFSEADRAQGDRPIALFI
ncbi:MAG TPA: hypothetical protein VF201_05790, partial [Nitrolancea sp.]